MTSITLRSPRHSPSEAPPRTFAKFLSTPWMWTIVACLLLGMSGGIRFWREHQFATLAAENDSPPFALREVPRNLENWRSDESMDDHLDPRVARVAGSSDYTVRTYLNEKSGDQIMALILYGLAEKVFGHMPDVCYPAAGYQLVEGPVDREMKVPGLKAPVRYRWAIYMKRVGGIGSYQETYHTFYYNREWVPDPSDQWKLFRSRPGMFKLQLARPISGLSNEVHGPSETLLGALVQEISGRLAQETAGGAAEATSVSKSSAPHSAAP